MYDTYSGQERVSDTLKVELEVVTRDQLGAGNCTQVLWKSSSALNQTPTLESIVLFSIPRSMVLLVACLYFNCHRLFSKHPFYFPVSGSVLGCLPLSQHFLTEVSCSVGMVLLSGVTQSLTH